MYWNGKLLVKLKTGYFLAVPRAKFIIQDWMYESAIQVVSVSTCHCLLSCVPLRGFCCDGFIVHQSRAGGLPFERPFICHLS